jgi:hypothetical protein
MPVESTGQWTATVTTSTTPSAPLVVGTGKLNAYLITTPQSETVTFYDSATTSTSGAVVIGYISASPPTGSFQAWDVPFRKGILIVGSAGSTVMTVIWTVG